MKRTLKLISALLLVMLIAGCSTDKKIDELADTLKIFKVILTSRSFLSEIPPRIDTVYFLKSKYISQAWPAKVNTLPIIYIPDTGTARSKNQPWLDEKQKDARYRYDIQDMKITGDSAYVRIYLYTFVRSLNFMLVKRDQDWSITKEWYIME